MRLNRQEWIELATAMGVTVLLGSAAVFLVLRPRGDGLSWRDKAAPLALPEPTSEQTSELIEMFNPAPPMPLEENHSDQEQTKPPRK